MTNSSKWKLIIDDDDDQSTDIIDNSTKTLRSNVVA